MRVGILGLARSGRAAAKLARSYDDEVFASWEKALAVPGVNGLVVGRSLLYPQSDDVAGAVDIAAGLVVRGS